MKDQVHNNLQEAIKILFGVILIAVFVVSVIHLSTGNIGDFIAALIWFIIIGVIELIILPTSKIYFDKKYIYIKRNRFAAKFELCQIERVKVSFNGSITTIYIKRDDKKKIVRCLNNFDTALKFNKVDPFGLNKGFRSGLSTIDKLKLYVSEIKGE